MSGAHRYGKEERVNYGCNMKEVRKYLFRFMPCVREGVFCRLLLASIRPPEDRVASLMVLAAALGALAAADGWVG